MPRGPPRTTASDAQGMTRSPLLALFVETCRILCADSQGMKQPEGPRNAGLSFQRINGSPNPIAQVSEAASLPLDSPPGLWFLLPPRQESWVGIRETAECRLAGHVEHKQRA